MFFSKKKSLDDDDDEEKADKIDDNRRSPGITRLVSDHPRLKSGKGASVKWCFVKLAYIYMT